MSNMSSLLKFVIYITIVYFAVTYITNDKLDDKSKYILIGLLVVPYFLIDFINSENFDSNIQLKQLRQVNVEKYNNYESDDEIKIKQPEIKEYNIRNILAEEEILLKKKLQEEEANKKILEEEKRRKILQEELLEKEIKEKQLKLAQLKQNKSISIENFDNLPKETYTADEVKKLLSLAKKSTIEHFDSPVSNSTGSILPLNSTNSLVSTKDPARVSRLYEPLGENGNGLTNTWDQDYILLNTDKWAPSLKPTPVCKAEKECPVCPSLTSGYPISVKEFDLSRKVTPPVNADLTSINT